MQEFKTHPRVLVADVDCTAAGKALCSQHSIRGYPTLKHGKPGSLKDYKGGRSLEALKKFAEGLAKGKPDL